MFGDPMIKLIEKKKISDDAYDVDNGKWNGVVRN